MLSAIRIPIAANSPAPPIKPSDATASVIGRTVRLCVTPRRRISGLTSAITDPVALGIIAGLVIGKTVGIFGVTFLLSKLTRASLDSTVRWVDVVGISMLAGIGFTVSLLIGDLAFGPGTERDDHVKIGVLAGSIMAALLASALLRARNTVYRKIHEDETRDDDQDGIPDVYQQRNP